MKNFYYLLVFSIVITTLLVAVSIYCLIKDRAKQKHLLSFHNPNIKFQKSWILIIKKGK